MTTSGPGSFDPKPVRAKVQGTYGGLERQTYAEDVIRELSLAQPPGRYELPNQVSIYLATHIFNFFSWMVVIRS